MLTDKVCGSSKNIIDKPIILAVTGPNCPDLTLVGILLYIYKRFTWYNKNTYNGLTKRYRINNN